MAKREHRRTWKLHTVHMEKRSPTHVGRGAQAHVERPTVATWGDAQGLTWGDAHNSWGPKNPSQTTLPFNRRRVTLEGPGLIPTQPVQVTRGVTDQDRWPRRDFYCLL